MWSLCFRLPLMLLGLGVEWPDCSSPVSSSTVGLFFQMMLVRVVPPGASDAAQDGGEAWLQETCLLTASWGSK